MALGQVDYGLMGLVGGLTVFITFFNNVLAGANSRFYAFSVGAAKTATDKVAALEECRHWFNTSLSVHTVVPFLLVACGYPIGVYAIEHWLTIPADRVTACVWVFRFVCVSCFVGMLNVPFRAMYTAKQFIAELTIYSFMTTTLNVIVLYYMVSHPAVWLVKFAFWTCLLSVTPQIVICIRACIIFPECKIRVSYMWDRARLRELGAFAGWQMLGAFCAMMRTNGMSIVINKFFGPVMNAAQAVGNSVQAHCNTLAGALQGAFTPVIVQACGAKDYEKMKSFAFRTCKFNVMMTAIFALPVALELPEIMRLWLKNPPDYAVGLCYCAMLYHLVGCITVGHMIVVGATGRVASYQAVMSSVNILTVPLAVVVGFLWRNVYAIMLTVVFMEVLNSIGRIWFARYLAGMSVTEWIRRVFLPVFVSVGLTGAFGFLPHFLLVQSFLRVCVTTFVCEATYLPIAWLMVLSQEERDFVKEKFGQRILRMFQR